MSFQWPPNQQSSGKSPQGENLYQNQPNGNNTKCTLPSLSPNKYSQIDSNDIGQDPPAGVILGSEFPYIQSLVDVSELFSQDCIPPVVSSNIHSFIDWRLSRKCIDMPPPSIAPFDYVSSFDHLISWAFQNLKESESLFSDFFASFDPFYLSFLEKQNNQTKEDAVHSELSLQRLMSESSPLLLELSGTPVAVWRYSGEILHTSKELGHILRIPDINNKLFGHYIYQLFSITSAIMFWKKFFLIAMDISSPQHFSLKVEMTTSVPLILWVTIKRDFLNAPQLLIGHFLPLFSA